MNTKNSNHLFVFIFPYITKEQKGFFKSLARVLEVHDKYRQNTIEEITSGTLDTKVWKNVYKDLP